MLLVENIYLQTLILIYYMYFQPGQRKGGFWKYNLFLSFICMLGADVIHKNCFSFHLGERISNFPIEIKVFLK